MAQSTLNFLNVLRSFVQDLYISLSLYPQLFESVLRQTRILTEPLASGQFSHRAIHPKYIFFEEIKQVYIPWWHFFLQESKQVCHYEMQGPGIPPLHNSGSLSMPTTTGASSGQTAETPTQSIPHLHPHLTSGRNLEIIWSKSHLVMRMIEMRIGQEPLLQVCTVCVQHGLRCSDCGQICDLTFGGLSSCLCFHCVS